MSFRDAIRHKLVTGRTPPDTQVISDKIDEFIQNLVAVKYAKAQVNWLLSLCIEVEIKDFLADLEDQDEIDSYQVRCDVSMSLTSDRLEIKVLYSAGGKKKLGTWVFEK